MIEDKPGPGLCIMLLTYKRLEYAKRTLSSVLEKKLYTRGHVYLHVASDGDSDEYIETLRKLEPSRVFANHRTFSNSRRGGYGANYNLGTQVVHQLPGVRYVLPLEDDWETIRELDLDHYSRVLDTGLVGCVRLGYLGWTQELRGSIGSADSDCILALDPGSAEPHVWAGHPRLETVEWERRVGPWPEGLVAGPTEFAVAHWPNARHGVGWPMSVDPRPGYGVFAHIGTDRAEDIA